MDASESSNAQVAPFFDTPIDDTMTLSAYNAQDAHFSWFDKMAAVIREGTQEQAARNWLAFQNYVSKGINALDFGYDIPDVSDSMSSVASMNVGKYTHKRVKDDTPISILTAEQLNKMYDTDKFKVDLREDLANDYLYNVQKREENDFIINYKKPLGGFSQVVGSGVAGFFEPSNLAASIATGGIFKGASLAKVAMSMAAESAVSTVIAEKGREQGSGADFSYDNVAIGTAIGTVLGTGIHFGVERLKGKDAITPQEAVKAARDTSPPANESADKLNEVVVNGSTEVKNDVINKVEDMVNSEADVDLDTVIKSVVPEKNETSIASVLESVQSSVDEVASANKIKNYSTVYGVKNEQGITVYDSDFNTAIDKAVLTNKTSVEASVLETGSNHLDLDTLTISTLVNDAPTNSLYKNLLEKLVEEEKLSVTYINNIGSTDIKKVEISETLIKHLLSMQHNMTDMDIMDAVAKMFNVNSFKLNNKIYDLKDSVVKAKDVKLTKEMFKDKPQSFLDKVKASPIFKNPEADKWVTEAKKIELANPKIVELESSNATIINNLKQVNKEGSVNIELQKALDEVDAHSKAFEAQYSLLKSATACLFGGKK